MLQVARLSPRLLGDSTDRILDFFKSQRTAEGGFAGRDGRPDLYYTVFGLSSLLALDADPDADTTQQFLETHTDIASLDLVHAASLARCWRCILRSPGADVTEQLLASAKHHLGDGADVTAYDHFLALGLYQDLECDPPDSAAVLQSLATLRSADGAFGNRPAMPAGNTTATAAAVAVLNTLDRSALDDSIGTWLLKRTCSKGGFYAVPGAPIPDLLSTATALHALATLHVSADNHKELTLDFIDTLWSGRGGFVGNWSDEILDCEYTFYGLLALGHLSVLGHRDGAS